MVQIHLVKNRQTGWTGVAATLFYETETHRLVDATHRFNEIKERIIQEGLDNNSKYKDTPLNKF